MITIMSNFNAEFNLNQFYLKPLYIILFFLQNKRLFLTVPVSASRRFNSWQVPVLPGGLYSYKRLITISGPVSQDITRFL